MNTKFTSEYKFPTFSVAVSHIFRQPLSSYYAEEQLQLTGCDLATYLICSDLASGRKSGLIFELSAERVATKTGYSLRQSKSSLSRLQASKHIRKLPSERLGAANFYQVCSPVTGQPLAEGVQSGLKLVLVRLGMKYLQVPKTLLDHLPTMSGVELQAVVTLLKMTYKKPEQKINAHTWALKAKVANVRDLHAATASMGWIAEIRHEPRATDIFVSMKNPVTGALLADEADARLDAEMKADFAKFHAEEKEIPRPYSSHELARWIRELNLSICHENDSGELMMFCPSCGHRGRPTLAINLEKGDYGIFYCHRCEFGRKKHLPHLLDTLGIDRKEAFDKLEELAGKRSDSNGSAMPTDSMTKNSQPRSILPGT